jgi:hypothetical protein
MEWQRRRAAVLGAGAVAGMTGLALGLLLIAGSESGAACYPGRPEVSDASPAPGDKVTISVPANECSRGYPADTTYTLLLNAGERSLPLGAFPIDRDGSFKQDIVVPHVPAGETYLTISSPAFPDCNDGDSTGKCLLPHVILYGS